MPHPTRATAAAALAITLAVPAAATAGGPSHLRNADTRAPVPVAGAPTVRVVEVPATGFDWGDAGIGAAGGLAIITLTGGIALVTAQRRRRPRLPAATR